MLYEEEFLIRMDDKVKRGIWVIVKKVYRFVIVVNDDWRIDDIPVLSRENNVVRHEIKEKVELRTERIEFNEVKKVFVSVRLIKNEFDNDSSAEFRREKILLVFVLMMKMLSKIKMVEIASKLKIFWVLI